MKKLFRKMTVYFLILAIGLIGSIAGSLSGAKAEAPLSIGFIDTSSSGSERISNQKFGVILSNKTTSDVTVDFKIDTISSTAVAKVDYKPYNGTVYVKAGELTRTVPLTICDDLLGGPSKKVVIKLSNPTHATLGVNDTYTFTILEDNMPTTSLSVNPPTPDGRDNWYITQPKVTLNRDRAGWTYYQWNTSDQGKWINYNGEISVPEGTNTLYYFSKDARDVDGGVKEPLQSKTFKVDTTKPGMPMVTIGINSDGFAQISWSKIIDAESYEIYRAGSSFGLLATLGKDINSYTDKTVSRNVSYNYKVVATDHAGNISFSGITTVMIPKVEISSNVASPTNTTVVTKMTKTFFKSIGTGVATSVDTASVAPTSVTPVVQGVSQSVDENTTKGETENARDWNKILLTIAILIIAAGATIGGYYGYEWWLAHKVEPQKEGKKNSKSRW